MTLAKVDGAEQFRRDVIQGLGQEQKSISSRYFYDAEGDRIFQRIMASPDYYPTRAEEEIFRDRPGDLLGALVGDRRTFDLVELGAGDGTKTMHLLRRALNEGREPIYRPVDISGHALEELGSALRKELPELQFRPLVAEYFHALQKLPKAQEHPKVILFLGSNIGNLDRTRAINLLDGISKSMGPLDRLLVGFDLKKDPATILRAYDDRDGHTRDFNLNLLRRINRELGADFKPEHYIHAPVYDPATGRALSYIVSTCDQVVRIPGAAYPIHFRKWEALHTEISQKYDTPMIEDLAHKADLRIMGTLTDSQGHFSDVVFAAY